MWTAKISQKDYTNGSLSVNVAYSNGSVGFNEVYDMTGASTDILSNRINTRLDSLNTTDALSSSLSVGAFTPTSTAPTPQANFLVALRHFQAVKRAVDYGLVADTDKVYTDVRLS